MDFEFKKRMLDLANRCYEKNIYTYSGFLTMPEISEFHTFERELSFAPWKLYGGLEDSERCIVRFGDEDMMGYSEDYPISCITIRPMNPKFSDALSHRDFLGSLMNLGIERDVLGDIIVRDNVGYVFCEDKMADFIGENIIRIKHTSVSCEIGKECPVDAASRFSFEDFTVSSIRCDALVSKAYNLSRGQAQQLFSGHKIFVNGRETEKAGLELKGGDIISVRGFGKFVYTGEFSATKKGKIRVSIKKYI